MFVKKTALENLSLWLEDRLKEAFEVFVIK